MVDGEGAQVGTVERLCGHLAEAVVAEVHIGDIGHVVAKEIVGERRELVEAEVEYLQQMGVLSLNGALGDAGDHVAADVERGDGRSG